ncbi:MAG: DUF3570 domain-containing protein [Thermodesulfobacteriota bacterium]
MAAISTRARRAVLAVLSMAMVLLSTGARAEDYTTAQAYLHAFDNGVTVYTGVFALNRDFNLDTSLYFKYNVDLINPDFFSEGGGGGDGDSLSGGSAVAAVSGASSAVSSGGVSDTRHEINGGVTHNFDNLFGVEAYVDFSHEQDYNSLTPSITLTKDLFDKNTTLSFGYSRNIDRISGQFIGSTQSRDTDNFYIGLTQVLSPVTVAQIGYARSESRGLMIEGIRLVPLGSVSASTCTVESATCVDEVAPSSRSRNSYMAGISHYYPGDGESFAARSALKLFFRYYDDDWDITSYTAEVEWDKYLDDDLVLGLMYRYYNQSRAFFVKDTYVAGDLYKSASPQLLSFDSHLAGVRLAYNIPGSSGGKGLRLGTIEGKYQFYTQSIGVNAHVMMASFNLLF